MGDRIAILDVGGVLEQYATPARDPRPSGVRHGARLRRCTTARSSACASRRSRSSASSIRPRCRPTRRWPSARAAIAKWDARLGRGRRRRRRAARLRRRRDGRRRRHRSTTRLQRVETWVPVEHDLQDVLATMLLTREGWVSVLDGDRFVGVPHPRGGVPHAAPVARPAPADTADKPEQTPDEKLVQTDDVAEHGR